MRKTFAPGKAISQRYLQIVRPTESGAIKDILVTEGAQVKAGQVLARMDARVSAAEQSVDPVALPAARRSWRWLADDLVGLAGRSEHVQLFLRILAEGEDLANIGDIPVDLFSRSAIAVDETPQPALTVQSRSCARSSSSKRRTD